MTARTVLEIARRVHARSEKDEERLADDLMAKLGYTVIRFSQARATKQTEGIPDRRYYHVERQHALWFECKAATGRQRPAQRAFQTMCEACGETYVLGTFEVLHAHMVAYQLHMRRGGA
jgi:hypothetical protein